MGISVIDHISEMVGPVPENEKFDCLGFLAARLLNPETLEDSIHRLCSYDSRIKKRLESKKIHFIGENKDIVGFINGSKRIWIMNVHDSFYLAIFAGLPRNDTETIQKALLRIPWIVSSWLKPEYLDKFYQEKSFAREYDRITVQKEYDPYFLRRRYSDVPPQLDKEKEWFFEGKVELRVRAPRISVDKYFSDVLREEVAETVKTKLTIHLTNPGNSRVTVDENTHIVHECSSSACK